MIRVRRSEERGHLDHGWLDTYHTFSFGEYHDPAHMHFSELRVINQDWVAPGAGFQTHGHRDMEIITYVYDGVLEHRDSMGNGSRMHAGEVQLMSAGTGVTHSEFNGSKSDPVELLQMWVLPAKRSTTPRYEQKSFPADERRGTLRLVVSPDGVDGSLTIGQDVRLYAGLLDDGESANFELQQGRRVWLHMARGTLELDGVTLQKGDGAAIEDQPTITIQGRDNAEFVLFDLP